ncbi:hypothetical protein ACQPYK_23450 [Streptosporangium sp. CA-135522]|uniref:hypothetical protein n=1 Tax=Streptosporangium sp. CA-135522 TaxID=3240072 RepID=UPI003D92DD49
MKYRIDSSPAISGNERSCSSCSSEDITEVLFTEVSRTTETTEPSDDPRGMLNAAMRTYCRLPAANPGPAQALVVESVACPAIRKVRAECITAWAQLMEALVAERRPDRPVPPRSGRLCICRPPPSRRAGSGF